MDDTSQPKEDSTANKKSDNQQPTPEPTMQSAPQFTQQSDRDIVWPLFLIFIGTIFLLNTTGVVGWNIWNVLWRFWPVFIIFAGLQLMLGKSQIAQWIIGLVAIILFAGLGLTALAIIESPILDQYNISIPKTWINIVSDVGEEKTSQLSIKANDYEDIDNLTLTMDVGGGTFNLNDGGDQDKIVDLEATYFDNWGEPTLEAEADGSKLNVSFGQKEQTVFLGLHNSSPSYDVTFGAFSYPSKIDIDLGAGTGTVDLEQVALEEVKADVGAGKLVITLAEDSIPESMDLDVGAGSLEINLPENVGYMIDYSIGAGQLNSRGDEIGGIGSDDDNHESDNFDQADVTVTIKADIGAGKITIN